MKLKFFSLPFRASYVWAAVIAAAVIIWMQSDDIWSSFKASNEIKTNDQEKTVLSIPEQQAITVNATLVENELTPLKIRASGVTKTLFEITFN